MSKIWLPRIPIHSELRPSKKKWEIVKTTKADLIRTWSGSSDNVYQMGVSNNDLFGYYHVGDKEGYFVKIVPIDQVEHHLKSARMAAWLKQKGFNVSELLPGFPLQKNNKYSVLVYDYIESHYAAYNETDLLALGKSLAKFHETLKSCPWKEEIKQAGEYRLDAIKNGLSDIHKGHYKEDIPRRVNKLLQVVPPEIIDSLSCNAQVIHGDLNYGNVLFNNDNNEVIFIDFEDTWYAWFDPLMDLSFTIERFGLTDSDEESALLSSAIISAYQDHAGIGFESPDQLSVLLQAQSIRALVLLSMVEKARECKMPESEWDKFLCLHQQAITRMALFHRILN